MLLCCVPEEISDLHALTGVAQGQEEYNRTVRAVKFRGNAAPNADGLMPPQCPGNYASTTASGGAGTPAIRLHRKRCCCIAMASMAWPHGGQRCA